MLQKIIPVMLVQPNREFRRILSFVFEGAADIHLLEQFDTAETTLAQLRVLRPAQPFIILLDLRLPEMSGLDALPLLRDSAPHAKVIILTEAGTEADVLAAISLGACGYLLKSSTFADIVSAIRAVYTGGAAIDPRVANHLLQVVKKTQLMLSPKIPAKLTGRELEILILLGEGLSKKRISARLGISYSTVDSHVSHLYEKLHVSNGPGAVTQGYRLGLIPSNVALPPAKT